MPPGSGVRWSEPSASFATRASPVLVASDCRAICAFRAAWALHAAAGCGCHAVFGFPAVSVAEAGEGRAVALAVVADFVQEGDFESF